MSEETTQVKPRWMATPRDHPILARVISPCEGAWHAERFGKDTELNTRLKRELLAANASSAQVFVPDPNIGLIPRDAPWTHLSLGDSCELRLHEPATAMWLLPRRAIVTELDGRPFVLAHGGSEWLALRYHDQCIDFIEEIFEAKAIACCNVHVRALFGTHKDVCDYYARLQSACEKRRMKYQCELRLPKDGKFFYEGNAAAGPNLGIFAIR